MGHLSLVGVLVCLGAGVLVFTLARASGARELAWERFRQDSDLAVLFADGIE